MMPTGTFTMNLIGGLVALMLAATPAIAADNGNGNSPSGKTQSHSEENGHDEGHNDEGGGGHDDEDGDERHVTLSEKQRPNVNIEQVRVKAGSAESVVKMTADVKFHPDTVTKVGPRLQAKVVEVKAKLGQRVSKGDTLAILDSVTLGKAKARYLSASAKLQVARKTYNRKDQLAKKNIVSEADRLEAFGVFVVARATRNAAGERLRLFGLSRKQIDDIDVGRDTPLSRLTLTATASGILQQRSTVAGDTLSASDTPFHIVDTSRMWLVLEAPESDVLNIEAGQEVDFTNNALGDHIFSGKIDWISLALDKNTRTAKVYVTLKNPEGLLRQGMSGTARVFVRSDDPVAMVPDTAVQQVHGKATVFVPGDTQGSFRAVSVRTGRTANGRTEILGGLAIDQRVVARGAFDLKSILTASGRSAEHSH